MECILLLDLNKKCSRMHILEYRESLGKEFMHNPRFKQVLVC